MGQPVPNDQYKFLVFFPCYSEGVADLLFDSTTYIDNVSGTVGESIVPIVPTSVTLDFEPDGLEGD